MGCNCKGREKIDKTIEEFEKIENNVIEINKEKNKNEPWLTIFFRFIIKLILSIITFALFLAVIPFFLLWILVRFMLGKSTSIRNPRKWFLKNGK